MIVLMRKLSSLPLKSGKTDCWMHAGEPLDNPTIQAALTEKMEVPGAEIERCFLLGVV
jgi:hypothetical protein